MALLAAARQDAEEIRRLDQELAASQGTVPARALGELWEGVQRVSVRAWVCLVLRVLYVRAS